MFNCTKDLRPKTIRAYSRGMEKTKPEHGENNLYAAGSFGATPARLMNEDYLEGVEDGTQTVWVIGGDELRRVV